MDEPSSGAADSEDQFWADLDNTLSMQFSTHGEIDDALRSFIATTTASKKLLESEYNVARCCSRLLDSHLFKTHEGYVRRQMLYCLLEEDDEDTLHLAVAVLLFDGRTHEAAFEMMQTEGAFRRLVQLIHAGKDDDLGLHRLLLELLFEMSRIRQLPRDDLMVVGDAFILYLFQLIEELSDDADDPYHYPVIRVLLVLNEQYMCCENSTHSPPQPGPGLTNRVLKLLSVHGPSYRTFGENLILLLNRETELEPQLLILKLLYLLFTTPPTYEYFYTNDLHVLVDVIIRNLLDLDPGTTEEGLATTKAELDGQQALRHTYLRVLCPLLKNTQLSRDDNNYKRDEVRKLLYVLVNRSSVHFAPVDETVIRLVLRCKQIEWLREEGDEQDEEMEKRLIELAPKETAVAKKLLGMSLEEANESTLSVIDVSSKLIKQKPTVPAPRRVRRAKATEKPKPANGSHENSLLQVPGQDNASLGAEISRTDTKSPFADDNAEN